jgi:hypothetical protein
MRSRAVAAALHDWLPIVVPGVEPWVSHKDIAAGGRWSQDVAKELEASNFGIICLTAENIAKPWVLFEAGALSKIVVEGAVVPYLFGIDEIQIDGPLSQFQGKKAEKTPTWEMVSSINDRVPRPENTVILERRFEGNWPQLAEKLAAVPPPTAEPIRPRRATEEILEDLTIRIQNLSGDVEAVKAMIEHDRSLRAEIARREEAAKSIQRALSDAERKRVAGLLRKLRHAEVDAEDASAAMVVEVIKNTKT